MMFVALGRELEKVEDDVLYDVRRPSTARLILRQ